MTSPDPSSIDAWLAGGSYFAFRGHQLFFRRSGQGTPLVCIHGYPTSSWDWYKVWPELTARFDVIVVDMLGFGYSAKPSGHRYSIFEQADLHVALLERLGIDRAHFFVHDYGVTVGQELLARHAEGKTPSMHSIAFLNGGLFPETHRARPIQRLLASPLGPVVTRLFSEVRFRLSLREVFGPNTQPSDAELRQLYTLMERADGKRALAGLISYMEERKQNRTRWVSAVVDAKIPMRFINGVQDPVSGAHMLDRLLEPRPDADVVRLDVGHYPQMEAPAAVLDAWLTFVDPIDRALTVRVG
jgi:pimeloyl-ACP methyl ester carboxylesterase